MVEYCSGGKPRPTQQRASKPLFQPGLVVSTINTLRRGHCIELMDINSLLIKIYFGKFNLHQKVNSGHVIQINNYFWDLFLEYWVFVQTFLFKNLIFYSFFNFFLLVFCANKSIVSETSRSISLCINIRLSHLT